MSFDTFHRNFFGQRTYLAELDVHFPELTLGQTLEFASFARDDGRQDRASRHLGGAKNNARTMASLFHLTQAYDTLIGNEVIRGVSGGEKRRTSIAEAYTSGAQLQCWDNSTRGLDSLTARRFVDHLRQSTDFLQSTVAMSLYQASESMFRVSQRRDSSFSSDSSSFHLRDSTRSYFSTRARRYSLDLSTWPRSTLSTSALLGQQMPQHLIS